MTQIANGDWVAVRGVDFGTAGAASFSARVASTASGGSIELRLGSATGTLIGTCSVPATGGAQTWANVTCNVTGATGVKDLYLKFTGTSSFNLNYWQFTPTSGGNSGTGGASSTGGAASTGGIGAVGGTTAGGTGASATGGSRATGGAPSAGGTAASTGGKASVGGAPATGGTLNVGGVTSVPATGGVSGVVTGGRASTGGVTNSTGGLASAGGAATTPPGTGGSPAAGGGPSSGGVPATTGGSVASGIGGQTGAATDSTSEGSCSCRLPGRPSNSKSLAAFALLGWVAQRTLRRRARRH